MIQQQTSKNSIYYLAEARDVPADGTCLFHALGYPFQINGHDLRKMISQYIQDNSEKEMHGQSIYQWILWDKEQKSTDYSTDLNEGMWGGALEMTLFSSLIGVPVFVYEPTTKDECKLISECYPDKNLQIYKTDTKNVTVLYVNRSHYMNLKVSQL